MPTPLTLRRLFLFSLTFAFFSGGAWALQTVALDGQWTDALTIASLPDGSLLVAQQSGLVDRLAPDGDGFKPAQTWADLGDNGKAQLLGFAVDPDFLSSGYIFAVLKILDPDKPVVQLTRWRDAAGLVVLNRVLVDDLPTGNERTGGVLKVSPDGHLWLGLGDGGAPAAEVVPAKLRGVLLRYNLDGTVPADNPDPASAVWAWGYRDPGALAWQPGTGRLYSLDRGPPVPRGTNDRLDIVEKGGDYGWPRYTARDYGRGVVRAVTFCSSGHSWVPNGAVFAVKGDWAGSLLFAGSGQGFLYRMSLDEKSPTKITFYDEMIQGDLGPLVDVALGPDDEPYVLSRQKLYRLIP
jgi:glucose/arabinose dehydrogenase